MTDVSEPRACFSCGAEFAAEEDGLPLRPTCDCVVLDDPALVNEPEEEGKAMSQLEREHYQEIRLLEVKVRELELEHGLAKDAASAAKKRFESADVELRGLIHRGPATQFELELAEAPQDTPAHEQLLDTVLSEVLTLSDKKAELLMEHGITTVREFEALRGGDGLASLPGVGSETASGWENEVLKYLEWLSNGEETNNAT